ncbi:hypothetical protein [Kitasatospora griseola]|uniref:hypothetical protein n=1 Tax=Kitasatospora griseola TaxID=2064 RepID=UPI003415F661
MRGLKRVLTVTALATPLVFGCVGLASAQGGGGANLGADQFISAENGAGVTSDNSADTGGAVQHADFGIWSDDTGVSGGSAGTDAAFGNG